MTNPEAIIFARALAVPNEQWRPLTAPLRNDYTARSAAALRAVAAQFDVATSNRYRPQTRVDATGQKKVTTFCKTFAWDVTRALDAELPHWIDAEGNPSKAGAPSVEIDCNALVDWLDKHGQRKGWGEVKTETAAATHAAAGGPAIAIWRNRSGPGHIAVLLPSPDTTTRIAQAGGRCFFDHPISDFGVAVKHLRFFIHP